MSEIPPKCDRDAPVEQPRQVTLEHLRRLADNCRDLDDPTLMTKAWDESTPPETRWQQLFDGETHCNGR
jgi:hypothetical protein